MTSDIVDLDPAATAEAAAPKTKKEKKEAFKIDFLTPSEESITIQQKKLFAAVTRGGGITLPASKSAIRTKTSKKLKGKKEQDKRDDQTLPDDMHFSSKQLVTLFLKPKFSVRSVFAYSIPFVNSVAA